MLGRVLSIGVFGRILEWYIGRYVRWLDRAAADPAGCQQRILGRILRRARRTAFGREHGFASIRTHADFVKAVPIADYAARADLYDRIFEGEPDVCWPGKPRYIALTSGTTARQKHIPVSAEMKQSQINSAGAIMAQVARAEPGLVNHIFSGKIYFFGGDPLKPTPGGARMGGLTDISVTWVPWYIRGWYVPGREPHPVLDYEWQCERLCRRLVRADLRLFGDMPSWGKRVFDRVCQLAGVAAEGGLSRVWPCFDLCVHGGMNFEPFRPVLRSYFHPEHRVRFLEVYLSSEGFIAVQPGFEPCGMELLVDNGIFFEFVPLEAWDSPDPPRLMVHEVEVGKPYCLVMSTSAGLWAYDLGDVVRFTSVNPPRVLFAGRHQQFMNAFGEHMIGEEVARAVAAACQATGAQVEAYTAAPVYPANGRALGGHQYIIEFLKPPAGDLAPFGDAIEQALYALNLNYAMKRRDAHIMAPAAIVPVPRGTFYAWMKKRGRLGGQNKVPTCANDRRYADDLLALVAEGGFHVMIGPPAKPGASGGVGADG